MCIERGRESERKRKREMVAQGLKLTSVAIIHSSFSSDITNTDLYLVSAHADISGAFFSDASLRNEQEGDVRMLTTEV